MNPVLTDIKRSLLESVRARLPGMTLLADPPEGTYLRPVAYLGFRDRKPNKKESSFGALVDDYSFDWVLEVRDEDADTAEKLRQMEGTFEIQQLITFYHFVGSAKYLREGLLKVTKFTLQESKKDREKNRITCDLVVTF